MNIHNPALSCNFPQTCWLGYALSLLRHIHLPSAYYEPKNPPEMTTTQMDIPPPPPNHQLPLTNPEISCKPCWVGYARPTSNHIHWSSTHYNLPPSPIMPHSQMDIPLDLVP